jgi:hypothetical protein
MGWQVLGEVPPAAVIAGGALCIGGVLVARSRRFSFRLGTPAVAEGSGLAD